MTEEGQAQGSVNHSETDGEDLCQTLGAHTLKCVLSVGANYTILCVSKCCTYTKLEILPIPSLYIYSLMLFLVDNLHYFQTNSSVHDINTSYKNQLHIPSVRLSAIHSAIKIFNKLPPSISRLKKDKSALRNYLLTHVFYSIEEFVSNH
jgi:hypothetical protein